ncbi:TonB-dependent receptor [Olivibacter ginsenosidimutans]|uniref:TonB-dependent receptor n=1 Tax=Olivibacter ginsenosidimutans TaxID=1176537 RepID=A0ABP9ABC5_9SPHI
MDFNLLPCLLSRVNKELIMRINLTVLLLTVCCIQLNAHAFGQQITLKEQNATLGQVLRKIESQSHFTFFYNKKEVQYTQLISISVDKANIKEVLTKLFQGQPYGYEILDELIVLHKKTLDQSTMSQHVPQSSNTERQGPITGQVTDSAGVALPGVSVIPKDRPSAGTTTDENGRFAIAVPKGAVLLVRMVGYKTQEITVGEERNVSVRLVSDISLLDDVVVVAYGIQKKANLTGSVAAVQTEDITVAPSSSTINTLAGRLPGLISQQSSGQPGADQAAINIRGFGQALWIVDGVESDFNNIDPNQIETISILKDGAASIYGARAGNGVVLVTTKRGRDGKPDITLNSSYTLQGNTTMTDPVNAGQYAEITNLFYTNQGKPAPYTDEQIQKFYAGNDPAYPNTNWKKVATRPWAPQTQQNLSVRGGSERIKYFGFFGYTNQDPIWRKNGGGYKRYNLQSNLDAKVNDNLTIQLNLSAVNEAKSQSVRGQGEGINTLWQDLWNSLPIYPSTLPDPTKHAYANGQGVGSIALISDEEIAGYDRNNIQNLKGTFIADYKIRAIEGLSAKAFINYDKTYLTNKNFSKPFEFYTYDYATDTYTLAGSLGTQARLIYRDDQSRNITGQLSLNYDHTFNRDHHVSALALYEVIDYNTHSITAGRDNFLTPAIEELYAGAVQTSQANSSATEMGRVSYVGRLNYTYKDKYLLESTLRADASAKFPSDRRWGYFPSISLGWKIDQENFAKSLTFVDELKLRTSYGTSGVDNVGDFRYLTGYQIDRQWLIGNGTQVGIASTGLPNPNLTWEKIKIYNVGIDFSLWRGRLFGTAETFYRTLSGIPATRILSLPNSFGATLPEENLNSQNNRGFELSLGTRGHMGELSYELTANLSWSRAKWDHYEEPVYTDPDQIRLNKVSGRWADVVDAGGNVMVGYVAEGLFTSQQEIDNLAFTYPGGNAALRPGDVKYVDLNGDGKLDFRDQKPVNAGTVPNWMAGATINLKYKNFDLQSLLQGAFNYYSTTYLYNGGLNYSQAFYENMWTEEHNSVDAAPRISGASSNSLFSNLYFKKASYLRLKTLALGYTLPKGILAGAGIHHVRVYLAGTNLLTVNPLKKYGVDPEAPSGQAGYYYPQQRTISLGVNVTL